MPARSVAALSGFRAILMTARGEVKLKPYLDTPLTRLFVLLFLVQMS
jgi:hypothetical protein